MSTEEALAAFYERLGGKEQGKLTALWKSWESVVGEDISSLGFPLGHKETVLHIGVDDSMALQDLSMQKEDILERVNDFMEADFFDDVAITLMQGKRDLSRPEETRSAPAPVTDSPPAWLPEEERPDVGKLLGKIPPDSPIARCYEAHVSMARKK